MDYLSGGNFKKIDKSRNKWGFYRVLQRGGKPANALVSRFVPILLPL